ncbi:MAG: NADH:flavin oxidoreductase [Vicinamibacterales bacterium]
MTRSGFPRVASLRNAQAFRAHLRASKIALEFDEQLEGAGSSPLGQPLEINGARIGNRFTILPMEGWDGTREGVPSDLTRRRWQRFGSSGAKLIWGGEAVAVRHDGRASPHQLLLTPATQGAIATLREDLVRAHVDRFGHGAADDLYVGLQLTHSGRFAKPDAADRPAPLAACANPILDGRLPQAAPVLSDDDLDRLIDNFVVAARLARDAGFSFVDVKQCHGYLGHELLGARTRPGRYGGSLENRFRFLRSVIGAIRGAVPGLHIGVRLSAFDFGPYRKTADGAGEPAPGGTDAGANGFGLMADDAQLEPALSEAHALLTMLETLDVRMVCVTAGSPYYCPHIVRPAFFPPMDGYQPPEDPLKGVARHIRATAILKAHFPGLVIVGSGYSYLQEWLPHVAQYSVRHGLTDTVGLGRMVLSYPDFPHDVLNGAPLRRAALCRSFSDCTTGPRMGFVSGCYPLDPAYEERPEAALVRNVRTQMAVGS